MNKIAFVLTGARAPLGRIVLTAAFMSLMSAAILLGSGCSSDDGNVTYPTPPEPQSQNWLFDVTGTGPNDVYAAGNKGGMFHYDGNDSNRWDYVDIGASTAIVSLWENEGTIYAVGHGGRIWNNTSGQWSSMESGTDKDLYGIGIFEDDIYACGAEGTLRVMNGNSWGNTPTQIVTRDPASGATTDTLSRESDLSSLLTVNYYFIGGAYNIPDYAEEPVGMLGTDGGVLTSDPEYDWLLRPLRGDQLAPSEWDLCTTSSANVLSRNFLGTSEGWLFQLEEEDSGGLVWVKKYPKVTIDPGNGIRDMWIDENDILYMVTDDGQVVIQSLDYNFDEDTGFRKVLYDQVNPLTGIWGTGSDNIYMVGLVENVLFKAAVDLADTTMTDPIVIPVDFPAKGMGIGPFEDELGRPRF